MHLPKLSVQDKRKKEKIQVQTLWIFATKMIHIKAKTDGKSLGNPGKAYWIALFDRKIDGSNRYYGEHNFGTNNEAEYNGVILALEKVPCNSKLTIETDSQLVWGQLTQDWKINQQTLFEKTQEIERLVDKKNIDLEVKWIPREKNTADFVLDKHLKKIGKLPNICPYCKRPLIEEKSN